MNERVKSLMTNKKHWRKIARKQLSHFNLPKEEINRIANQLQRAYCQDQRSKETDREAYDRMMENAKEGGVRFGKEAMKLHEERVIKDHLAKRQAILDG